VISVLKIKLTIKEDNFQLSDIFLAVANCPAKEDFRTENDQQTFILVI
jgi:hypothetical protein